MPNRLIIRLTGGVGNQLFQYAFGRVKSFQDSRALILDKLSYELKNERKLGRKFALDQFHIAAIEPAIRDRLYIRAMNTRFLSRFIRMLSRSYVREDTFDRDMYKLAHACPYVTGYWQSYEYFDCFRDLIRSDLTFKTSVDHEPLAHMIHAAGQGAVMLHIRRGDYLTDSNHRVLGFEYYQRAVAQLAQAYASDLTIFVFTDDPEWARQNVSFDGVAVVIAADYRDDAERDLQLMTMCYHHILANSSFSWWSRYLSKDAGVCIAPKNWHIPGSNKEIARLIPPHWVLL
ncbi:alpha-1,2-fucosyltransferase [Chromobacterium violaceum]|uniref:alpha-1,2-fucosyltransferase n=1 Tax=Chromobacterium violaceum TaxID=536 RepID=UPI001CE0F780|nr:alpha-1,2-fucosyltransferase [Chromobacterium violaceum]